MAHLAPADLIAPARIGAMSTLDALTSSISATRDQLFERLSGLEDGEYLWEPVEGMWTVRQTAEGWKADWASSDPEPPPVTTIAWRMWHIAVDALDSYSRRTFGTTGTHREGAEWVGTAREAIDLTRAAFDTFVIGFETVGEDGLQHQLGDAWNHYSEATHLELFLHALREVTHHAAEIGLLRDLYRSRRRMPLG